MEIVLLSIGLDQRLRCQYTVINFWNVEVQYKWILLSMKGTDPELSDEWHIPLQPMDC